MSQSPRLGPYEYSATESVTASDTAAALDDTLIAQAQPGGPNRAAQYALIQVRDYGILWNLAGDDGDTPAQTDIGAEFTAPNGTPIILNGESAIARFRYINAVAGNDARLVIQLGF